MSDYNFTSRKHYLEDLLTNGHEHVRISSRNFILHTRGRKNLLGSQKNKQTTTTTKTRSPVIHTHTHTQTHTHSSHCSHTHSCPSFANNLVSINLRVKGAHCKIDGLRGESSEEETSCAVIKAGSFKNAQTSRDI